MTADLAQHPISSANASGFPLQIATATAINNSHHWCVVFEEHPWRTEEGAQGFIDIVAGNRKCQPPLEFFVIECKRVRQASWVFLVPKLPPSTRRQTILWGSQFADGAWRKYDWENWTSDPPSFQSEYCVIPGQDQGRMNLLERTASELVDSVEALASQERELHARSGTAAFARVYVPVLVTTAKLLVACFDPLSVSLAEGTLPKDTATEEVPYVRFHKGLGTYKGPLNGETLQELHSLSQRTVFVVNAEKLPSFLNEFELGG